MKKHKVYLSASQQEEHGQAEKWKDIMDMGRTEKRQDEAMSREKKKNITLTSIHQHSKTQIMHVHSGSTHA